MEANRIILGDSLEILKTLPDGSIDCVMTSPPYFALRDYGVAGQLGLEPTFEEYITKLCDIFDEVKRVLKKEGTCWVNLGDTYSGSNAGRNGDGSVAANMKKYPVQAQAIPKVNTNFGNLPDKSLCLIPMRFAIEMVNRGWILRNDIIWFKRNSMPTSVKDRFANKWEHLFFFVKSKRYYFNLDSVRKPHMAASVNRINAGFSKKVSFNYRVREACKVPLQAKFGDKYTATEEEKVHYNEKYNQLNDKAYLRKVLGVPHDSTNVHPLGGNPGDVMQIDEAHGDFWDITTQAHPFAHFACYPERLCEIPIKAGCTEGGIVLDPFVGSGTTALVALKLNRRFLGIELNPAYIEIASKRLEPFLNQSKLTELK